MYTNPYYFSRQGNSTGAQLGTPTTEEMANKNIQPVANPMPQGTAQPRGQFNTAGVANAIGGAASIVGDAIGQANQRLGINTDIAPIQNTPYDKPVYTGGQLGSQIAGARPQGATGGEILKGVGSGASAGMAFGPWGAAIGAVVGAAGSLIGGGVRKSRQRRERSRARTKLNQAQTQYNTADVNFRNRQARMEDYQEQQDSSNRLANLYRSQY